MGTAIGLGVFVIALAGLAAGVSSARVCSARRRAYAKAIDRFVSGETWSAGGTTTAGENDPATWYFAGVQGLREGRVREAARAFGIAHHADHRLITAALLTFAGLKASGGGSSDLIQAIAQTWREMKRPALRASEVDALMMDALVQSGAPRMAGLSDLGTLTWCVTSDAERTRLRELIASGPEWARDLRA